jgi:hypothetical protein
MEEEKEADFYTADKETEKSAEAWNKKVEKAEILKNVYNLSVEEVREHFKYSGGDGNRNCDSSYNSVRASSHLRYWRLTRGDEYFPVHRKQCICGMIISENCYIVDTRNKDLIVIVGNDCIDRFCSADKAGRTCDKCGGAHRNSKYNLCNECKPQPGWIKCEDCNEPCRKRDRLCETHKRLKQKNEMEQRRQSIATMSDTDTDTEEEIERKCACGKVLTGSYKKCYNCYIGIDPNATHPCETCEKPVKGTFKNCYLCNQKLRKEKG